MANVLTTNPIIIDTAGVIFAKGIPYTIKALSFQASADDDDVRLADAADNTIWQGKVGDVSVDGYNIDVNLGFGTNGYTANSGLTCSVIDGQGSSTLLIYI